MHKRFDCYSASDEKSANSLGGIKFVACNAQKIHPQVVHQRWDFSNRLGRVGMKNDPFFPGYFADLRQRLDRPHFVVCVHDTDQDRLCGYSPANRFRIDEAGAVNRQVADRKSKPLQPIERVEDRRMFDGSGYDVLAASAIGECGADEGMVVGLCAAAGEDDLFRITAQ